MKNKKKHFITALLATLFLILVLYLIFHDSLGEIKTQLFQADKKALLILVIFGNLYILLDGWVLHYMIVKNREKCTLWQAIRLAYMVVFFGCRLRYGLKNMAVRSMIRRCGKILHARNNAFIDHP